MHDWKRLFARNSARVIMELRIFQAHRCRKALAQPCTKTIFFETDGFGLNASKRSQGLSFPPNPAFPVAPQVCRTKSDHRSLTLS